MSERDDAEDEAMGLAKEAGIFVVDPRESLSMKEGPTKEMSAVSKNYDFGKKGYLDDTERIMRDYDKNNDGQLDMAEVHKIVRDLQEQHTKVMGERRKVLTLKRAVVFLVAFTLVLALSTLGVSFAAATLAKDTAVDSGTRSLTDKRTGEGLSTVPAARRNVVELAMADDDGGEEEGDEDEGEKEEDNDGDGGGRRLLASSASSPAALELRRRLEGRGLFPCFRGSGCGGGTPDRHTGNDRDRGRAPRNPEVVFRHSDWDFCRQFEGTVRSAEMGRIRASFHNGEDSVNVFFTYGGLTYRKRIVIETGVFDSHTNFLVIESGADLDCNSRGCTIYKPVYIFDNCGGVGCDLYTCSLGLAF